MIPDTAAQDRPIAAAQVDPMRRRLLIGSAVVILSLLAFAMPTLGRWLGAQQSVSGERLRIAEVRRDTLVRDVAVQGRVVAAVSPTLYAPVAATVVLRKQAGDRVRKDDVLLELDSPELTNELARERSTLQQLEAELGGARIDSDRSRLQARGEADEAAIALQAARRDLQRIERAWKAGALAEIDALRARDVMKSAEIRSRNAATGTQLAVQDAGFEVQTRRQQLQRQQLVVTELERRVDQLSVRAPVNGVIGTLSVDDRAAVAANTALLTVVDLSRLEVELEVPEAYADELGLGMQVEVRVGAANAAAKLSAISPEVVNNRVLVRVRFDRGQPPGLRQNQRVSARVLIEERPDVLLVARGPFVEAHGGNHAYFVVDGMAERRPIRVGATSVSAIEILEGAKPGDSIVIAGSDAFGDAARVTINR